MANELAMITVAIISSCSTLAGAGLNWVLSNITASENSKRSDRNALRELTEERYLEVQTTLEFIFRTSTREKDIDRDLASLNARILLFGSEEVREAYRFFSKKVGEYEEAYRACETRYKTPFDASDDFPKEWGSAMSAMYKVSEAMRNHLIQIQRPA